MTIGWWLLFVVITQWASYHADSHSLYLPSGNTVKRLFMLDIKLFCRHFMRLLQDYTLCS